MDTVVPKAEPVNLALGGSRIRIYRMNFPSILVISAQGRFLKIRHFCGLAVKDHLEPQTNNILLIICLGQLLSHTPAQLSLTLPEQLLRLFKGNPELNLAQESERIVFRRSKD